MSKQCPPCTSPTPPSLLCEVEIASAIPGRLYRHSLPGRYEEYARFQREAKTLRISCIVCLCPLEEIQRKSAEYGTAIAVGDYPCPTMIFHPVEDYSEPDDPLIFDEMCVGLAMQLRAGARVLIHCAGGVGRTGLAVESVLSHLQSPDSRKGGAAATSATRT